MRLHEYKKNNLKEETCSESAAHVSVLKRMSDSRGQTLIETVVAIFILVMGISTAIGLAIYSFQNTDNATKAIVGTSLAREAIEGIKNKRDSNWVYADMHSDYYDCSFSGTITQTCDPDWAQGLASGSYAIDFVSQNPNIDPSNSQDVLTPSPVSYQLLYCPASGGANANTYISSSAGGSCLVAAQPTIYSRKVTLNLTDTDSNDPTSGQVFSFVNRDNGNTYPALLDVVATVWWQSRRCPTTNDPSTLPTSCKVVLETHLLNWRKLF